MKALVMAVVVLASMAAALPLPVAKARKSALVVWANGEPVCSGFATSIKLATTAAHCVRTISNTYAISTFDEPTRLIPIRVIARRYDTTFDQATLYVTDDTLLTPIFKCKEQPNQGDPLYIWAAPLGYVDLLRMGYYSGRIYSLANPLMNNVLKGAHTTTINIDQGASGAAVLTEQGCYVGLVVLRWSPSLKIDGAIYRFVQ